ncbi:MAG TPA: pyridoxal-dependent decarboxylase [Stellaceae bacterium]|nr:pyridoxal-dependent decarboxylase [Stellaceae bacterium]
MAAPFIVRHAGVGMPEEAGPADGERSLDPEDWKAFRHLAHRLLDVCIDRLEGARDEPVWRAVPPATKQALKTGLPRGGTPLPRVCEDFLSLIFPYPTGNIHPRFFGWVHGTGTATAMLAELCAAAMNSNCGGRDHAAIYVERQVIAWCREIFGFPETASGLLTAGTSSATVIALTAARRAHSGPPGAARPHLVAYASAEAHAALGKALELIGLGSDSLRPVPVTPDFRMDLDGLRMAIAADRAGGCTPFCVIATAGTVNTGAFDDIAAIAEICAEQRLWLHVDGAFGAWARLADPAWRCLTRGIERADSLAFDFHKWMYVQYDCGAVLIRDEKIHRAAFSRRPDYLGPQGAALAGGDPWYCEYGIDLSRGFRALKVWFTLREFGLARLGAKISDNCRQARHMAALVERHPHLALLAPAVSNICCFRYVAAELGEPELDALNAAIVARLQESGIVAFSTTRLRGRLAIRAAIANHRTRREDIAASIAAVAATGGELLRERRKPASGATRRRQ